MTTVGTTPETPNHYAGFLFPEALLRDFLVYKFSELSRTAFDPRSRFFDELFGKAGPEIVKQIKTWWSEHENIQVTINYPRADIHLPFVSVVNAGENEKVEERPLGHYGGQALYGTRNVTEDPELMGVDPQPNRAPAAYVRDVLTMSMADTTKIYVAGQDPNVCVYITRVIQALVLQNIIDFDRYGGMRNMTYSCSDLEHHPELFPDFAYFKVVTLAYDTQFDVPQPPVRTISGIDTTFTAFLATLTG